MKNLITFENFKFDLLSESNIYETEINKIFNDLKKMNRKTSIYIGNSAYKLITVEFKNNLKSLPDDIKSYINTMSYPKSLLKIDVALGYGLGNSLNFTFANTDKEYKFNTVYHLTNGKNINSIKKNGLVPMPNTEQTNVFKYKSGQGSFHKLTYNACFVCTNKTTIKQVQMLFDFKDPTVIKLNAKDKIFYVDPFIRSKNHTYSAFLTLEKFKPEDILEIYPFVK